MKSRVREYQWHIEWREPSELKPYEYNAKLHDDKQVKNIANSIKNVHYRYWTSRPTDEQREVTSWEPPKEET